MIVEGEKSICPSFSRVTQPFSFFLPPCLSLLCVALFTHIIHTRTHTRTHIQLARPVTSGRVSRNDARGIGSALYSVAMLERISASRTLSTGACPLVFVFQLFFFRMSEIRPSPFRCTKTRARARRAEFSRKKCDPSPQSYHPECRRESQFTIGPI